MNRTAPETATVWLTNRALTKGVMEAIGCEVWDHGYVCRGNYGSPNFVSAELGKTAFLSEGQAIADAIKKARAKLKAIEKQRAKIEGMISEWEAKGETR